MANLSVATYLREILATLSTGLAPAPEPLTYLGTIEADAADAETNATTGDDFEIPAGARLVLQGDVAFYPARGDGPAVATDSPKVEQNALFPFDLGAEEDTLSVLSVSGTVKVKVFLRGE